MRTAILFLIGIALIVLIGSFVPQQDTSAQTKVDEFQLTHHNLDVLTSHLGLPLTQVFVSPLFYVLLGSLYIALASCVLRRGTALLRRTVRGHPRTPQYWGEWGSWLFHSSFFLLLIAVVWGKATGFEGIATVTEGERVTEARTGFDTLREGFLFDGHHAGYQVGLNRFHATYATTGAPTDFVSNVTVYDHGRAVETRDIRVNDFLGYRDVDFYQQDYGWAPHLVVRNPAGRTVYDGRVQLFGNDKSAQTGVLKVPDFGYRIPGASRPLQLGAKLVIFPDARTRQRVGDGGAIVPDATGYAPGGQEARNPVLLVQLFVGDLGLDPGGRRTSPSSTPRRCRRTSATAAACRSRSPTRSASPSPAPTARAPDAACFTLAFPDLRQYSLFHVKRDNGVPLVYASFVLVMVGLLTKLYLRPLLELRRRRRRAPVAVPLPEAAPIPAPDYAWLASASAAVEPPADAPISPGAR